MWEVCSKNTGLQGSTVSGPRMTMGFGPFELPTHGLLQKGHSLPKFWFMRSPAFWLASYCYWAFSAMNIQITKQIGSGVSGWSYG